MNDAQPTTSAESTAVAEHDADVASPPASPAARRADPEPASAFDLDSPELYLNRELTWLGFNRRVLHEAADPRTPLLERVKFLAIVSSNLDEFFMKRIGGLMQQLRAGVQELSIDGRTPEQQIDECHELVRQIKAEQARLRDVLIGELAGQGIRITRVEDLTADQRKAMREHYQTNIFPLITPLVMDPAHPFPFISNLSLNLLLTVRPPGADSPALVRIKVPVGRGVPRFLKVGEEEIYVPLEEVIANNLDLPLPGLAVESCCSASPATRSSRNPPSSRTTCSSSSKGSCVTANSRRRCVSRSRRTWIRCTEGCSRPSSASTRRSTCSRSTASWPSGTCSRSARSTDPTCAMRRTTRSTIRASCTPLTSSTRSANAVRSCSSIRTSPS